MFVTFLTQTRLKGKLGTPRALQGHLDTRRALWALKALKALEPLYLVDSNQVQSFQDILEMTNEKTIYQKNLKCLAKEINKFLHDLSPPSHLTSKKLRNLELTQ